MPAGMNSRKRTQSINREDLLRAQVCRTGMMEIEALKINRKSERPRRRSTDLQKKEDKCAKRCRETVEPEPK